MDLSGPSIDVKLKERKKERKLSALRTGLITSEGLVEFSNTHPKLT